MSLPEFSNTNTTYTEPDFVPDDGLDSSHSPSIQNKNTFQLIGSAWNSSNKQQKTAFSVMMLLVFGLPIFIGLGLGNRQLINQKAAEPITAPVPDPTYSPIPSSTPSASIKPIPSIKPTIKPSATKLPIKKPIPIPSPGNPVF